MIRKIAISLTNKCTKNCWFCYADSKPAGDKFISTEELIKLVYEIHSHHPGVQFPLGGGEPTEHPDFIDIVDFLEKIEASYSVTSNLKNMQKLEKIRRGTIYGSIHHPEETEAVVSKLENFDNKGVNVLVAKKFLPQIRETLDILEKKGIFYILTFLKPFGRAQELNPEEFMSKAEIAEFLKSLIKKYNHPIATESCLFITKNDTCTCGVSWVTLTEEGELKPNSFHKRGVKLEEFSLKGLLKAYSKIDKAVHNLTPLYK